MSRSLIQILKSNSLTQFPNLKRLILRGNKIDLIENHALDRVAKLEDLDLRENSLKDLPSKMFKKIKLKVLYLANNPFSCEPSKVQALISEVKFLTSEQYSLEEFDGGLLKCAEPQYMKDVQLINIIDADAEKKSSSHRSNTTIKLKAVLGIVIGIVSLAISAIGAVFIVIKRKESKKYHYNFLTSTEDEEDNQPKNNKREESLASRLMKQRKQSQGYPSKDIIDSDEEMAVDQESYVKEKLKAQRRHSMGYALDNDSDDMEEINLETP